MNWFSFWKKNNDLPKQCDCEKPLIYINNRKPTLNDIDPDIMIWLDRSALSTKYQTVWYNSQWDGDKDPRWIEYIRKD